MHLPGARRESTSYVCVVWGIIVLLMPLVIDCGRTERAASGCGCLEKKQCCMSVRSTVKNI